MEYRHPNLGVSGSILESDEAQFKSLVRFTFFLQAKADQVVLNTDNVLARTMLSIKEIVKSLPAEGLLRQQSWKAWNRW